MTFRANRDETEVTRGFDSLVVGDAPYGRVSAHPTAARVGPVATLRATHTGNRMSGKLVRIIRIAVVLAWIVAGVDASPWWFELSPDASLLTVAAACVGSYALISRANARPVDEVMNAGIEIGRRRALLEVESENVTPMGPVRGSSRLRVVSQR